jgi:hypothetical protein
MTIDRSSLYEDLAHRAPLVLDGRSPISAPRSPWQDGHGYPLARDVDGDLAAVSFAVRHRGTTERDAWACMVMVLTRTGNAWIPGDTYDDTTTARPFGRPQVAENSSGGWVDWTSNGPVWGQGATAVHSCFGVAPAGTTEIQLVANGVVRSLEITRFSGAYVAVSRGVASELRGFGADGTALGRLRVPGAS